MKCYLVLCISLLLVLTGCQNDTALSDVNEQLVLKESQILDLEQAILNKDFEINELKTDLDTLKVELNDLKTLEPIETPVLVSSSLLDVAFDVLGLIATEDFNGVSSYVDPTLGLRFSPYSYINIASDLWFNQSQVSLLPSDPTVYLWGTYDGSGDPISKVFHDYYNEFIYDETYMLPHMIGNNVIIGTGNMINNIGVVYPTASFVEFHFTGFNPIYDQMDWTSLRLIFENVGGDWKLIGIQHDQWTI